MHLNTGLGLPAVPTVPTVPDDGVTHTATRWFDWLLGAPLQVTITIVVGVVLLGLVRWGISHAVRTVIMGGSRVHHRARGLLLRARAGATVPGDDALTVARRVQRAETMGSVLRSTAALVVGLLVVTVIANLLDWDLGPVLASAGVVGVALGFGAQTLVKDFLAGLFMLIEDQYGVGDVVDVGEASGTVEAIGLRVTQLRDLSGTLWYVRNGEILRVGNMTQGWSKARVEVLIPPDQDVARATELLKGVAADVAADPELAPYLLADADVTAYEGLTAEAVTLRLLIKVAPAKQWEVQRAARSRIRTVFAEAGVGLALPRREVLVEREVTPAQPGPGEESQRSLK